MADVVAAHLYSTVRPRNYMVCYCGYRPEHASEWAEHVAAELAAAGYGNMADAWDMGYTSGHSRAMRMMSDEPKVEPGTNPYRGAGHE
jgi:hypothetical protein